MASLLSSVNFTPSMKRSYSDAFDEDDCHQQQKWHISEKLVAASSTTSLQQIWGKTMDRLITGSKQFWNSNQPGIPSTEQQAQSNTELNFPLTITHQPIDRSCGQQSIKNYFNSTSSRPISSVEPLSTPMDTMDSPPPPPHSSSNPGIVAQSSALPHISKAKFNMSFPYALPSSSKDCASANLFDFNSQAGAVFSRTPGSGPAPTSSLRQLTLNKCGRIAGSFVPRGLPDVAQTPLPSCSDCQVVSQQPWYLLDPSLKCHECDRPQCNSCLKACFKCEQPFCALCRMNSFQHSDCNKTICIRCIS